MHKSKLGAWNFDHFTTEKRTGGRQRILNNRKKRVLVVKPVIIVYYVYSKTKHKLWQMTFQRILKFLLSQRIQKTGQHIKENQRPLSKLALLLMMANDYKNDVYLKL